MEEPAGIGTCDDQDTFPLAAAQAAFDNDGALITGLGGVGKSWILNKIRALYNAQNFRTDVIAFTHVQSQNVDGDTVLHDIYNNVRCKERVLIIDEASMIPLRLWSVIASMKYVGCRIIVLGDFAGQ